MLYCLSFAAYGTEMIQLKARTTAVFGHAINDYRFLEAFWNIAPFLVAYTTVGSKIGIAWTSGNSF